jgi:tetratricopeptide (TPR) repeat protein
MDQLIDLFNSGRYIELEQQARALLDKKPESGFFWKVLSVALQMQGKDALVALRKACNLLPDDAEASSNLGNTLRDLGQLNEAAAQFQHALTLKPDSAEVNSNLGNVLRDLGDFSGALECYQRALRIKPNYAEAHYNRGIVLREIGQLHEAITSYQLAIAEKPDFAEAYNNLGVALRDAGRLDNAKSSLIRALEYNPQFADAHYNLGNVHNDRGDFEAAVQQYKMALDLRPNHVETRNNLGNALKDAGHLNDACDAYEAAIRIQPDLIAAHYSLSQLKTYCDSDSHLGMLEQLLPNMATQPVEARIQFCFTLGKVREDLGLYDAAFAAYEEGNRLKRSLLKYDEDAEQTLFERVKTVFSKDFFATAHSATSPSTQSKKSPIFIVGMPRSGTSLIEQILSTYPGVFGAGELSDLSDIVTAAMPEGQFTNFPNAILNFSAADFKDMGERYVDRIWRHAPNALHIIDKMPANFFYVGLIHQMLPHAKIIHAMRDPMDSCFSCYSRLFINENLGFSYDLKTLGRYYERYITLMDHWDAVLPPGSVLNLRYEELIDDTEMQARRLLAYLDLPWDANCLEFHQNKRQVKTASLAQVRKPIYKTSVTRWQHFSDHLAPLYDLVKQHHTKPNY